jgi:membrane protein DedA with SNARE-associated domain
MSHLHDVLTAAAPWLREYGYPALAVAVGVEGFGPPAPGQTLLIGAAILGDEGRLNIALVLATAWLAAVAGDNIGYWIGRRGGRSALLKLRVPRRRLDRLDRFYHRYGVWLVLVARFFDGTRQLGGIVAGSAWLAWPRFLLFDALGCMAWVGVWGWGTYQLGLHASAIRQRFRDVDPWVVGLAVAALVLGIVLLFWGRRTRHGRPHHWKRRNTPAAQTNARTAGAALGACALFAAFAFWARSDRRRRHTSHRNRQGSSSLVLPRNGQPWRLEDKNSLTPRSAQGAVGSFGSAGLPGSSGSPRPL